MEHSTSNSFLSKSQTWTEAIKQQALLMNPGKDQYVDQLIHMLYQWAENDQALTLEGFMFAYKIPKSTFWEWCERWERLKKAVTDVKQILAMRRHEGCMTNKYNLSAAMRDMHMLDEKWDEVNRYHAALRNKDEDKPTQIVVNMADYAKEQK